MSIRGAAAIIGLAEAKPERQRLDITRVGLAAKTALECIRDAGLHPSDIDGLIDEISQVGVPSMLAEYLQIRPTWAHSIGAYGAAGALSVALAASAVQSGMAKNVLCLLSSEVSSGGGGGIAFDQAQFEDPYGPPIAANGYYALIAQRHAFEYGTTDEQRAKVAVMQRENAQANPDAFFYGTPITEEDVLNSRMITSPLRLLECVMPTSGSAAVLVTAADRAESGPNQPVYILGTGFYADHDMVAHAPKMTTSPVAVSARRAFDMAGLGPADIDMTSLYDCYTITVMISLEDAGFCPKGESGPFVESTDLTYRGELPTNTHGGQLSFSQPGGAGGMSHVTESVRQMMGRAGERQVADLDYCFVNG